jgi:hypothetical protein
VIKQENHFGRTMENHERWRKRRKGNKRGEKRRKMKIEER